MIMAEKEIQLKTIEELKAEAQAAITTGDYAKVESLARQIRKVMQAEYVAKEVQHQQALLDITNQIREDLANKESKLLKAILPYYQKAEKLVGERACFGLYLDSKEINVYTVKKQAKSKSGNPVSGFTKGEPKTNELLGLYGEAKGVVRFDKAEHKGTFSELYNLAKGATDKKNAIYNVRIAVVNHHKEQTGS